MNETITLRDIAGFCPERALWQLIIDLCDLAEHEEISFHPGNIVVDRDTFGLVNHHAQMPEFFAPEHVNGHNATATERVWSLGAIVFYASLGHIPFGGHGSEYQRSHPSVALPALQKSHQSLTPLVQRCLRHDPAQRISLEELKRLALTGLASCHALRAKRSSFFQPTHSVITSQADPWPENMLAYSCQLSAVSNKQ